MHTKLDVAIAYDEGIDEGERRTGLRIAAAENRVAILESEVKRLQRTLSATQSRLADREKLVFAIVCVPEAFGLRRDIPTIKDIP